MYHLISKVMGFLLVGTVSAAHPDWAKCAAFGWGHASSRKAAKEMLEALKTQRPEAFEALATDEAWNT